MAPLAATQVNGSVHLQIYATGFRADALEAVLAELAPFALRYGATGYRVFRAADDLYKFVMQFEFSDKDAWDDFWNGPEFTRFRAVRSGWFQVPLVYQWQDIVVAGGLPAEAAGNGVGAGVEAQGAARLGA